MRIHHLALRTRDLERLRGFYQGLLGLAPIRAPEGEEAEGRVWLRAGDAILMLERADAEDPLIPAGSMELVAFAIDETERERWASALSAAKLPFTSSPYTLYFRDPDGRRVGLSFYRVE